MRNVQLQKVPQKRLKIALVCDWFLPRLGGIELHLKNLAKNLNAVGHEAHIVTATPGPNIVEGIKVHRLNVPVIPGVKLCYGRRSKREFEKVLRAEQYDVIHSHYLLSTMAHGSIYIARKMNIPTVFTHHSINVEFHSRIMQFFAPYLCSLIGLLLFGILAKPRAFRPDVVTAVSKAVAIDLARFYRTQDVDILPNGIDPKEWEVPHNVRDKVFVTSVMRLVRSKQPLRLVQAIPRINAQLPIHKRPVFQIIGDGPLKINMEEEAARLGVSDQVLFRGICQRDEIKQAFAKSQLFVLPSTREGFGIAVLEARTAGIPVIAMNHGGV